MPRSGVEIIKDDLTPLLREVRFRMNEEQRKFALRKICAQVVASNHRNFVAAKFAPTMGAELSPWRSWNLGKGMYYSPGTCGYRRKRDSQWHWNKRASGYGKGEKGTRYSESSQLLQDTGRLRNSIGTAEVRQGLGSNEFGILSVDGNGFTVGTKVPYASKQNDMRSIISIDRITIEKIVSFLIRYLSGAPIPNNLEAL
jgi:hypothetical protein